MKRLIITGDIIIGDPCEMVCTEEDWQLCEWGEHMEKLGINNYLYIDFKDEAQKIVDNSKNILGTFCTDSSAIVIMKLDDLLNYNKTFNQHIVFPENWTIIRKFKGTITSEFINDRCVIKGYGNICFFNI